jgi:hypothetical protein
MTTGLMAPGLRPRWSFPQSLFRRTVDIFFFIWENELEKKEGNEIKLYRLMRVTGNDQWLMDENYNEDRASTEKWRKPGETHNGHGNCTPQLARWGFSTKGATKTALGCHAWANLFSKSEIRRLLSIRWAEASK